MASATCHKAKLSFQSPIELHREYDAFECLGCHALIEIPPAINGRPDLMLEMREEIDQDHSKCMALIDVKYIDVFQGCPA